MLESYVLEGIEQEFLLVIKSKDRSKLLSVIDRLRSSRAQWLKDLADELEQSLYQTDDKIIKEQAANRRKPAKKTTKKL